MRINRLKSLVSTLFVCVILIVFDDIESFSQPTNTPLKSINFIQEDLTMPLGLAYVDGWLFLHEHFSDNKILAYDAATGDKTLEFGPNGRGPGEYLSVLIHKGPGKNYLEVIDTINKKSDVYDVLCLKSLTDNHRSTSCIVQTRIITASRYALSLTDQLSVNHSASARGILYLSDGEKTLNYISEIPKDILSKYKRPNHAALSMTGRLTANLDRTYFAYFADSFDYALFYNRSGTDITSVNELGYTFLPSFNVQTFNGSSAVFQPAEDYTYTFGSPDTGKENYYVLYSGKQSSIEDSNKDAEWRAFTNRVKVFNWRGVEQKELILDKEVFVIAISMDERTLFGIHFDREMNPTIIKVLL